MLFILAPLYGRKEDVARDESSQPPSIPIVEALYELPDLRANRVERALASGRISEACHLDARCSDGPTRPECERVSRPRDGDTQRDEEHRDIRDAEVRRALPPQAFWIGDSNAGSPK